MSKNSLSLLCLGLAAIALTAPAGLAQIIEVRIATGSDDAEQHLNAGMDVASTDLEMPYEDGGSPGTDEQLTCLRFLVPVERGMKVVNAYVEFTCDETKGGTNPVNLVIEGQLAVNPPTFTTAANNLTGRAPWTQAQVAWSVENWTTTGQKSRTPNIASVIQEIINQSGWVSGHALVLAFRDDKSNPSTGIRCTDAYEDGADLAARLYIEVSKVPASVLSPADGAADVPWDATLSWMAGQYAAAHDVYLGTAFADVDNAGRANPMSVLVSQGQTDTEFSADAPFEFGRTYYWRIDEVNGAPDNTVFKGQTWSFTVEPFAYAVTPVAATASSAQPGMGPENTINGSGLNAADQHSTELTDMWTSEGVQPNWIQYEFDKVYKLYELRVWNSNQLIETFLGFGAKDVTIEYSVDGATWSVLEGVPEFAKATAKATYTANTTVDLGGVMARFVKLTINTNWGGMAPQTGLAEVRFFHVPAAAREPQPAAGATDVSVDTDLNWRPGREAESHEVSFGADPSALALLGTVTDHVATPAGLEFATTYHWEVDEIGGDGPYEGEVWSFTTQEYAAIDDMESYNDDDNRIYDSWIDGLTDAAKGASQVGYDVSPFAEKMIVHGGGQAMPLIYDNAASPFVSEAECTFGSPQNWTTHGADSVAVHFRGLAPGFAETAGGNIVMNGMGADIWNNADQFRFAYKTLNGNGTMVARVESLVNSNVWAKGGVMIRQSIEPGSTYAIMAISPGGSSSGNGANFQHRLAANGAATSSGSSETVVGPPYWVKIERSGNTFTGSISPDGQTWTQVGATGQTITMTGPVLIGLALCSHDAAIVTSAEFSSIAATGNVTGNWQVAEIGAAQPAGNSAEGLYVVVKDSSGKSVIVQNPDAAATANVAWRQWKIPLSEFTAAGVKMNAVKSITVGVGTKAAPVKGGAGTVYIDDIGFGRSRP